MSSEVIRFKIAQSPKEQWFNDLQQNTPEQKHVASLTDYLQSSNVTA